MLLLFYSFWKERNLIMSCIILELVSHIRNFSLFFSLFLWNFFLCYCSSFIYKGGICSLKKQHLSKFSLFSFYIFVTLVGNSLPISQVREDVAAAYIHETEWRATELLLPYKKMCLQRKVRKFSWLLKFDVMQLQETRVWTTCVILNAGGGRHCYNWIKRCAKCNSRQGCWVSHYQAHYWFSFS